MNPRLATGLAVILILIIFGGRFVRIIPPGHVGVAVLFGSVQDDPVKEGFHIVNPLLSWETFDIRQKTLKETALVPTRDQLQTKLDVSVQFRLVGSMAPDILRNTGRIEQMRDVHLIPTLRSLVREQGATIAKAEDFFNDDTRARLESGLLGELQARLTTKGFEIQDVLVRDIALPAVLTKAIELKKEREQAVERQKAELERFRTEQQQKVALAEAERAAAEQEAAKKKILADARAYEIREINKATASNPAYVQLQALEALKSMSKDPAAKIYFMDGQSTTPLPLMHMGDRP
jgi:regulator of protease activity HflC (stomatin/prohibitin superfamily)